MYDFNNDIWLCHSLGDQCYNVTAFQPAINVLKEIQVFLEANSSKITTPKSVMEASIGIAYQCRYVVENQCGDGGMKAGSWPNPA